MGRRRPRGAKGGQVIVKDKLAEFFVVDEASRRVFEWWCAHPLLFALLLGAYVGFITGVLFSILLGHG